MARRRVDPCIADAWLLVPPYGPAPTFSKFIETLAECKTKKHRLNDDLRTLVLDSVPSGTDYKTLLKLVPTDAARKELEGMHMVWATVWEQR